MTTRVREERRTTEGIPPEPPAVSGAAWPRAAALGGFVFFGLFVAFANLTSNTPAATDTRQEVFSYLTRHHDRLQLAAALYGLAMPAALLFLSGLFTALRTAEGGRARVAVAALSGGILAAAATVSGALVLGTTATRYVDLGPAGGRVFWTMFLLSIGATLLGEALMIGTTAVVSLRTRLFPRWFSVVTAVLACASVVGAFTIGYTATGIQATAGVAALLDAVWILLVSRYLWRRRDLTDR